MLARAPLRRSSQRPGQGVWEGTATVPSGRSTGCSPGGKGPGDQLEAGDETGNPAEGARLPHPTVRPPRFVTGPLPRQPLQKFSRPDLSPRDGSLQRPQTLQAASLWGHRDPQTQSKAPSHERASGGPGHQRPFKLPAKPGTCFGDLASAVHCGAGGHGVGNREGRERSRGPP